MAHPYKSFEENRHGRAVAQKRMQGYQSGGNVRKVPQEGMQVDLQRLQSAMGVDSGRVATRLGGNVVYGPGVSPTTGGPKPSVLRRWQERDEMPMAKGGRVRRRQEGGPVSELENVSRAINTMGNLRKNAGESVIPDKDEYYKRGGKIIGGADSGVGRLQLAKRAARKY